MKNIALFGAAGKIGTRISNRMQGDAGYRMLYEVGPQVTRWLVFPASGKFFGGTPTAAVLGAAHRHLAGITPNAQFAAGTDTDFIFVQRICRLWTRSTC